MMGRRSSELYQVDFVAALFGGFLLVWLSGVSEAEFAGNGSGELLKPFNLTVVASFIDGGNVARRHVVPLSAFNAGCAPEAMVKKLQDAGLGLISCQSTGSQLLNSGDTKTNLQDRAIYMATSEHRQQRQIAGRAFAFDIDILFGDPSSLKPALFSGSVGGDNATLSEVGIIPRGADVPSSVRLHSWERRGFFVSLTDGQPLSLVPAPPTFFYKYPNAESTRVQSPNGIWLPAKSLSSFEVRLEASSDGSLMCWDAIIKSPESEGKFEPC
ncbi:hypothetical protein ACU8OS_35410 (plasmid) [Rhizobium leguminosarum]